ncbi:MAG: hypothetical protein R2707_20875 [Acidimicrobiales bacterium]
MRSITRIVGALAVVLVIAAACSDDAVDQVQVDDVVDDLLDEGAETSTPESEDPPSDAEEPPAEPEEPPAVVVAEPEDNCVILRHYQATGLFDTAPYYVTVTTRIDIVEDDEVTVTMPGDVEFDLGVWPTDDVEGIGQIDVNFPVFGPGPVGLPEVMVNGEPLGLADLFWGGNTSFEAAGADVRDEEIYGKTIPCTAPYMVQIDPNSIS